MNLPSVFVWVEFSSEMGEGGGVLNLSTLLCLGKVVTIWGELNKDDFTLVHAILLISAIVWCISIELNWDKKTKRYDYSPWIKFWKSIFEFIKSGFISCSSCFNNNLKTVIAEFVDSPFKGVVVLWYLLESLQDFISDLCHLS